ncbi:MAG TPA: Uma2 family endonuclease [Polyangiaceae bacterium]|nr:Uma2 family endonuclease [Polyangiaceae bacterium]HMR74745.1 Uma2 family endonuclease [Polyangiaceae bacterium]
MISRAPQRFSFADYVELEERATVRHEFLDGWVWAMAGGSPTHARIAANVTTLLNGMLRDRPCAVFSSDLRIRSSETGLTTYADVTVVCGELELDSEDQSGHTALNPSLVVEVLSPSTEDYDRGEKLGHYRTIASMRCVVLVSTDTYQVDVWSRDEAGWSSKSFCEGAADLASMGSQLELAEVYRDPLQHP